MRPHWMFAGLIGAAVVLSAAPERRTPAMERVRSDQEDLEAVEKQSPASVLRGDASFIARYTAEDFQGTDPGGRKVTRADVLARLKAPDIQIESLRHEDVRVRVFGDCAVATARTVLRARHGQQDVSGVFPYMRVWVRRDGRWQAVAALSTVQPRDSPGQK